jgi:double-stranded uracil-DNA glycosylase
VRGAGRADVSHTHDVIIYRYAGAQLLFVGINPHPGSFARGVPFSNNKSFWYHLSAAGLVDESREELRSDKSLRQMYTTRFNDVYRLGLVNLVHRPTRGSSELRKGEERSGRARVARIIEREQPRVVCFIGKVAYENYVGHRDFSFGWRDRTSGPRIFVMHAPLHGEAIVRVRELRTVHRAARRQAHLAVVAKG